VLLKFIQSISSNGPVGLWKLRLFRGTPVCSRQTPILQPTANRVSPVPRLEPTVL
jgi:hypothetical protein